jgi:hypothetical protein
LIQHQQQQHHNTKAGASSTSTLGWKSSARSWHLNNIRTSWKLEIFSTRWHLNNINTKLEIFSTRLASQQHQHEAGNLQHEVGITTTSARSWKSSARGWHHNNINMKAGNLQHEAGINTTPPFEGGPFRLHQAYLESAQTLHETEAWSTHLQPVHPC